MIQLETYRTILRSLKLNDRNDIYEFCKLKNVAEMIGKTPLVSIEHTNEYLKFEIEKDELYAIECKNTNKVIGTIGLRKPKILSNTRILRIELNPTSWGKGYAVEVAKEVIKYAFDNLNIEKIIGGYYSFNKQSKAVNEKLGFVYQERIKDIYKYNGTLVDSIVCALNYQEFKHISKHW